MTEPDPDLDRLYAAHVTHLEAAYGAAITAAGFDTLVIHAGNAALQNRFDDNHWPLRRTPAFAHWLPLDEAGAALIMIPGATPRLVRLAQSSYWEAPTPSDGDHVWGRFRLSEISDSSHLRAELPPGRCAFIGDPADAAALGLADPAAVNPAALLAGLDAVRTRKTDYERWCLGVASGRAAAGHRRLAAAFADGDPSELGLRLLYLETTGQDDADTPYKNIVALGAHAATLHYVCYRRQPPRPRAQSLLVDAGARCFGYGSDITRTWVRGDGAAAATFAALIAGVEALQQEVIRRVRPGLDYEALHDQAHELLASVLRDTGIGRGSAEELVARGVTRAFLPHGLGHSLGIQVHDVGCRLRAPRADNPWLRNTSAIEVGQVFTIEPGCYFIDVLLDALRAGAQRDLVDWDTVAAIAPFGGVRIEDNVAVVPGGIENLTRDNWTVAD